MVRPGPNGRELVSMRWGLIPAWWEEDREGARRKQRQPHLFTAADGSPILGLAGLSDRWRDRKRRGTFLHHHRGRPNAWMAQYHDRMPVILEPKDFDGLA